LNSRMKDKVLEFGRDLREYAGPFYYGASTNAAGGVIFGVFSCYFNPQIPMPQTVFHLLLRVLFGVSAGVAYSLGAFCFSLPYVDKFSRLVDKRVESETARDVIYSFLSIGASLLVFLVFAYILFFVYRGRFPVKMNSDWTYVTLSWFTSSLSYTNWAEVALIPVSGILIKGSLRVVKGLFHRHLGNSSEKENLKTP